MTLTIDRKELDRFVAACFRNADLDTFVSMRAFFDHKDGFALRDDWRTVRINGNPEDITDAAEDLAGLAAFDDEAIVFAPPVCTFTDLFKADVEHLANGLVITAELDTNPAAGRAALEAILGPATIVMESGGLWLDPATGELIPKLHLHWRLSKPTRTKIEHDFLREANRLAASLAGGDASAITLVHPLRWPGSWHRKAAPRLARIVTYNPETEISCAEALNELRVAAKEAPATRAGNGHDRTFHNQTAPAELLDIAAALAVIPNDDADPGSYKRWDDMGLDFVMNTPDHALAGAETAFYLFEHPVAFGGGQDRGDVSLAGALAPARGCADEHRKEVEAMGSPARPGRAGRAEHVADHHQQGDQQRDGVGLGLVLDRPNDVAGEPVKRLGVDFRPRLLFRGLAP